MRDAGFDFSWTDKYAPNLLARGFEADGSDYSIAVAFEVLEHLINPLDFLKEAKKTFGFQVCFFSATCFDERNLPDLDWWYWAFETGQHVSFFSERTLHFIAHELGMQLVRIQGDVYAFTSVPGKIVRPRGRLEHLLQRKDQLLQRIGLTGLFASAPKPTSLTFSDHLALREQLRLRSRQAAGS